MIELTPSKKEEKNKKHKKNYTEEKKYITKHLS